MTTKPVFWMDEEENAAYPEMLQLKFKLIEIVYMRDVDRALNMILSTEFDAERYSAFIIDAHMPTFGDSRLEALDVHIHKSLAGVRLCAYLANSHSTLWGKLRTKTLLYTNLPQSPRVESVRQFSDNHGMQFCHKRNDGEVYDRLDELGWI